MGLDVRIHPALDQGRDAGDRVSLDVDDTASHGLMGPGCFSDAPVIRYVRRGRSDYRGASKLVVFVLLPSWPTVLSPQAQRVWSDLMARAKSLPAATAIHGPPVGTCAGVLLVMLLPFPS